MKYYSIFIHQHKDHQKSSSIFLSVLLMDPEGHTKKFHFSFSFAIFSHKNLKNFRNFIHFFSSHSLTFSSPNFLYLWFLRGFGVGGEIEL